MLPLWTVEFSQKAATDFNEIILHTFKHADIQSLPIRRMGMKANTSKLAHLSLSLIESNTKHSKPPKTAGLCRPFSA